MVLTLSLVFNLFSSQFVRLAYDEHHNALPSRPLEEGGRAGWASWCIWCRRSADAGAGAGGGLRVRAHGFFEATRVFAPMRVIRVREGRAMSVLLLRSGSPYAPRQPNKPRRLLASGEAPP
jgi:hypothetical protein